MPFIKKHLVFIICFAVSLCAWPYGPVAGLIVGFFADFIFQRIKEERELRKSVESGNVKAAAEPFKGCATVCALGVYCCGDGDIAAKAAGSVFGKKYKADWKMFCRAAQNSEGVNGDLLTECMASILLKAVAEKNSDVPVKEIFEFLKIVEMNWKEAEFGEKPSVNLGNLLNYRCVSSEVEEAYKVLGLTSDASIEEVKKAHRKMAAQYHPDKTGEAELFQKIQKAYEVIIEN